MLYGLKAVLKRIFHSAKNKSLGGKLVCIFIFLHEICRSTNMLKSFTGRKTPTIKC